VCGRTFSFSPRRPDRRAGGRQVHHETDKDLPRLLRRILDGAPAGRTGADRAGQKVQGDRPPLISRSHRPGRRHFGIGSFVFNDFRCRFVPSSRASHASRSGCSPSSWPRRSNRALPRNYHIMICVFARKRSRRSYAQASAGAKSPAASCTSERPPCLPDSPVRRAGPCIPCRGSSSSAL